MPSLKNSGSYVLSALLLLAVLYLAALLSSNYESYPNRKPSKIEVLGFSGLARGERRISFLKTPKTGGTSLWYMLVESNINGLLPQGSLIYPNSSRESKFAFGNLEVCLSLLYDSSNYNIGIMRSPRLHVISQYSMCRSSPWGMRKTNGSRFPRSNNDISDFILWLQHFHPSNSSVLRPKYDSYCKNNMFVTEDFNCYNPINMMTRHFSSVTTPSCPQKCSPHHKFRNLPSNVDMHDARVNLAKFDFIIVTELFNLSWCLLCSKIGMAIPEWCFNKFIPTDVRHVRHNISSSSFKALLFSDSSATISKWK